MAQSVLYVSTYRVRLVCLIIVMQNVYILLFLLFKNFLKKCQKMPYFAIQNNCYLVYLICTKILAICCFMYALC